VELDSESIIAASGTLLDRLSGGFPPVEGAATDGAGSTRLARWRELAAGGDEVAFTRRLSWDGLAIDEVRPPLGGVGRGRTQHGSPWIVTLEAVLGVSGPAPVGHDAIIDPDRPVPFEEALLPFVSTARRALESRDDAPPVELSSAAREDLHRGLLGSLEWLAGRCLQLEFEKFRAIRRTAFARVLESSTGVTSRDVYDAFVRHLTGGGLAAFFERYPVLARLLAREVESWVETTAEMLRRLAADLGSIERRFGNGCELGRVDRIQTGLSDRHRGGRTVALITFASGSRVVFKPRPVGMEAGFARLVAWINDHRPPLRLKPLEVLERDGHGWVGFIDQLPCRDSAEGERFYRRAGMLLAVLYALGGSDVHFENVVAHGEHPVPVDLESLFHPVVRPDAEGRRNPPGGDTPDRPARPSVANVGLLPADIEGPRGEPIDLSGLGHILVQPTSYREPVWRDINTDRMSLDLEDYMSHPAGNVPILDGAPLQPGDHTEAIVDGFRAMYGFLGDHRDALAAESGPLAPMRSEWSRFIARPSQVYADVLKRALRPDALRDGADFGIELEVLYRPLLRSPEKPSLWPIVRHEIRALEQLDIPYFTCTPGSASLPLGPDEAIEGCFAEAAFEQVIDRLERMDEEDLERQTAIIRESFESAG
jgi:type 2 lantibiotic biosynthesis protein LanM